VGSNYLICENGISMKGRNEIFIHRSVFHKNALIYSPGLFGRDMNLELQDENSGYLIKKKYPEIFKGTKKLIIYKLDKDERTNIEATIIDKITKNKKNPNDYMLFKYSEVNRNLEPFIEWVASKYFINQGYIFENQCPFFQQSFGYKDKKLTGGIPDISAFKISLLKVFSKYGITNENRGLLINKIPHLVNFNLINNEKSIYTDINYKLILGEVKTDISSYKQAKVQLLKYKEVDLADELYFFIPNIDKSDNEYFGLGSISDNKLIVEQSKKNNYVNKEHIKEDERWLEIYLKINLLGNLPFKVVEECLRKECKGNNKSLYSYHLLDYAINKDVDEIIQIIIKYYGIH